MLIRKFKTLFWGLLLLSTTSCLEKPKEHPETITAEDSFQKILDDIVGPGTISPDSIAVGQHDVTVEYTTIAGSLKRERYRRELTVKSVQKSGNQTQYKFTVNAILRDDQGNPQDPVSTERTLILAVTPEGYYQFAGDGTDYTTFSWDFMIGLRNFCHSYENDTDIVKLTCSSIEVEATTYAPLNIPVRKLSLNRSFEVTSKSTGAVQTGKLHYTFQIAPGIQEISKMVSFCVEGLQKYENTVYYLTNCNNVESF